MVKPRFGVALLIASIIVSGCAWFETREDLTASELAAEGMDAYEFGNYRTAIEHFEKLKDWYPFSKFAILAELKIADAHYRLKEYEEAIFAYESFENLHPRNEAIPYVIYQIGRCYFDRLDTVDRDQTFARKSLEVFGRLVERFPGDRYARDAGAHRLDCLKSLAEHEFYVGRYYYNNKRYKAALERFRGVLFNYPDVGVHYPMLQYLGRCEAELQASQKAAGAEDDNEDDNEDDK
jgi:outer membrane protein assembly factor BamD